MDTLFCDPSEVTLTNFITQCCIEYTSPERAGFELKTLLVTDIDCTGSHKSN